MHEQPIKLILLKEKLNESLPILFTAKRRLDIKNWAQRGGQLQFFP